ncbi:MAG: hypothetical protein SO089_01595 [Dialister sp.]|nr:hypothetical protein [Dialister sp.]
MDHTNSEDTIFAVNTEIQMMYTARWVRRSDDLFFIYGERFL